MDYHELISSYNNKGLDINGLKEKLKIARPLKGRLKYRAIDIISQRSAILNDINNLLITLEKGEKVDEFNKNTDTILVEYYSILVNSITSLKAWRFMKLDIEEYAIDKFETLNKKEQFRKILELNREYFKFLEYQNVADIRDCLKNANGFNDDIIRKLEFIRLMFDQFKNKEIKIEFFCFDKDFLTSLCWSRKFKNLKLEDFMKSRKKTIQEEYKKFLQFFSNEDFRIVSKNLDLTSKTLKTSVSNVIEAYSEMSESEAEVYYIEEEFKQINELLIKHKRMQIIKKEYEKEKKEQEKIRIEKEKLEKAQKALEAKEAKKLEKNKKQKKEKTEDVKEIKDDNEVPKEQVNPIIFSWLEKDNLTLARRVGSKNLTKFFDKIKEIQNSTGIRASLYIVTNTEKEVTLKRLEDFKKKAAQSGLSNLVEGALGGYSSFRVDKNGNITDIAEMTNKDKEKIMNLLENNSQVMLSREFASEAELPYLRYQMSDKKDKTINRKYLNLLISKLLKDENIRKEPLKFLSYMEGKKMGIDVLLEEQLKGISQLSEYYKEKYLVFHGKAMNIRIDNLEAFINEE